MKLSTLGYHQCYFNLFFLHFHLLCQLLLPFLSDALQILLSLWQISFQCSGTLGSNRIDVNSYLTDMQPVLIKRIE